MTVDPSEGRGVEAAASAVVPLIRWLTTIAAIVAVLVLVVEVVGRPELPLPTSALAISAVINVAAAVAAHVGDVRALLVDPRRRWVVELWPVALAVTTVLAQQNLGPTATLPTLGAIATLMVTGVVARNRVSAVVFTVVATSLVAATVRAQSPDWSTTLAVVGFGLFVILLMVATREGYQRAVEEEGQTSDELARYATGLEAVATSARDIHVLEIDAVLRAITETTSRLQWDRCALYVPSRDSGELVLAAVRGTEVRVVDTPRRGGVLEEVLRTQATVIRRDDESGPDHDPDDGGHEVVVGTPVTASGETVGGLVVGRRTPVVTDSDVRLVELVATQAGRALEIARSFAVQRGVVDEARRLAQAKDDFVATVSHELRTPLGVVLGMAETLLNHGDDAGPEVRDRFIARIHANAVELTELVSTLLDLARVDGNQLGTTETTVDLVAVVEVVAERTRAAHQEHDVVVEAPHLGTTYARGDPVLLDRVVDNLAANACHHTPAGTRVRLIVERHPEVVRVSVGDDGPGIDPADLPHVRERFYRGGHHLRRPTRGLGLGLSICSEILRRHDSELEVESQPGVGTTFSFEIDRAGVGLPPADGPPSTRRPEGATTDPAHPGR